MNATKLTFDHFVSSLVKNHYRKFGISEWGNSTIPIRFILLSEKQASLYVKLFQQKVLEMEKNSNLEVGSWSLHKDGSEVASLHHKSGMAFTYPKHIKDKSFAVLNHNTNKNIWVSNKNHAWLVIKKFMQTDNNFTIRQRALNWWNNLPLYNMDKPNKRLFAAKYYQTEQSLLTDENITYIWQQEHIKL